MRLLTWFVVTAGLAAAQPAANNIRVETYRSPVDGTDQPYAIYVPKNLDLNRLYPLVVSLHGEGTNHVLSLQRVLGRPSVQNIVGVRVSQTAATLDFIVVAPLARGTIGYQGMGEREVYAALAEVERRYPIDTDRVYLTGESMGGGGALWLGLTRPDVWAAIAPVCADAPGGTKDLAPNALTLPVRLFHGELDPLIPVARSREWQKLLLSLDTPVDYMEYAQARHNAGDFAYRNTSLLDWFAGRARNGMPERVRYVTRDYEHRKAYWVEIDGLTPGTLTSIDARFTAANRIAVVTNGVDGFTLRVNGHPLLRAKQAVEITVDGTRVSMIDAKPFAGDFSLVRTAGRWAAGRYVPRPTEKQAGAEGPMVRAVSGRQIYVYGTADAPGAAERQRRLLEATEAADWRVLGFSPQVKMRIVADDELSEAEMGGADLMLFGTRETNRLIARWASVLPMELNAGAADFGLLQVVASEGRYLMVNSGAPWWRDAGGRELTRYLPQKLAMIETMGDYVVFRRSLRNIVAEGLFDRDWKLPAAVAEKVRATGAVSIH